MTKMERMKASGMQSKADSQFGHGGKKDVFVA